MCRNNRRFMSWRNTSHCCAHLKNSRYELVFSRGKREKLHPLVNRYVVNLMRFVVTLYAWMPLVPLSSEVIMEPKYDAAPCKLTPRWHHKTGNLKTPHANQHALTNMLIRLLWPRSPSVWVAGPVIIVLKFNKRLKLNLKWLPALHKVHVYKGKRYVIYLTTGKLLHGKKSTQAHCLSEETWISYLNDGLIKMCVCGGGGGIDTVSV